MNITDKEKEEIRKLESNFNSGLISFTGLKKGNDYIFSTNIFKLLNNKNYSWLRYNLKCPEKVEYFSIPECLVDEKLIYNFYLRVIAEYIKFNNDKLLERDIDFISTVFILCNIIFRKYVENNLIIKTDEDMIDANALVLHSIDDYFINESYGYQYVNKDKKLINARLFITTADFISVIIHANTNCCDLDIYPILQLMKFIDIPSIDNKCINPENSLNAYYGFVSTITSNVFKEDTVPSKIYETLFAYHCMFSRKLLRLKVPEGHMNSVSDCVVKPSSAF